MSVSLFDDAKVRALWIVANKKSRFRRKSHILLIYVKVCVRTHMKNRIFLCAHTVWRNLWNLELQKGGVGCGEGYTLFIYNKRRSEWAGVAGAGVSRWDRAVWRMWTVFEADVLNSGNALLG